MVKTIKAKLKLLKLFRYPKQERVEAGKRGRAGARGGSELIVFGS